MMWLVHIPFANRTWALPIITALAPPEHYHRDRGRRHKTVVDWARQMICQLRRLEPDRPIVVVADGGYAVMDLYGFCQSMTRPVTMVTRMRLDASLHEPAAPRRPGQQVGRPRVKGARLPRLKDLADHPATRWTRVEASWYGGKTRALQIASGTALWYRSGKTPVPVRWVLVTDPQGKRDVEALACTDPDADPLQIVNWYVKRWQVEVTFQEARAHLGMETQRQWSDLAIARTTPALLGLFSWVTLAAHCLSEDRPVTPRSDAMYPKDEATFADALALVRRRLWTATGGFCTSGANPGHTKIPPRQCERMLEFVAHAA